jgi:hypothetical protein
MSVRKRLNLLVCFDAVLDEIQSRNIEEAEHVNGHPGNNAPADRIKKELGIKNLQAHKPEGRKY